MNYALRPYFLAAILAVGAAAVAIAVVHAYDLPIRDPDGVAGPSYLRLPGAVALFVALDVVPRMIKRRGGLRDILRERYGPERVGLVAMGLAVFYVSYVSYRNLKGALPFARPEQHDRQLLNLDRLLAFGHDPGNLLHALLGTGIAAHLLSTVYLAFLAFVPLSLGAALVWSRRIWTGAFYVTALSLNWLLGALSYYLIPSLGPVFVRPDIVADLPRTGVTALQQSLEQARFDVLMNPHGTEEIAGVAGFASLHVSIVFTAALVAHRVGLPRVLRWALWVYFGATVVATIYFGWHYLVDDIAGVALGAAAVAIADRATQHVREGHELAPPEPAAPELVGSGSLRERA